MKRLLQLSVRNHALYWPYIDHVTFPIATTALPELPEVFSPWSKLNMPFLITILLPLLLVLKALSSVDFYYLSTYESSATALAGSSVTYTTGYFSFSLSFSLSFISLLFSRLSTGWSGFSNVVGVPIPGVNYDYLGTYYIKTVPVQKPIASIDVWYFYGSQFAWYLSITSNYILIFIINACD